MKQIIYVAICAQKKLHKFYCTSIGFLVSVQFAAILYHIFDLIHS